MKVITHTPKSPLRFQDLLVGECFRFKDPNWAKRDICLKVEVHIQKTSAAFRQIGYLNLHTGNAYADGACHELTNREVERTSATLVEGYEE